MKERTGWASTLGRVSIGEEERGGGEVQKVRNIHVYIYAHQPTDRGRKTKQKKQHMYVTCTPFLAITFFSFLAKLN